MSYLRDSMGDGEVVVLESRISLWMYAGEIFLLAALLPLALFFKSPVLFVVTMILGICVYLAYQSTELAVTNRRVFAKFGIISRNVVEVRSSKVEGVTMNQSIVGRIFDYGTIVIVGSGGTEVLIPCVCEPLDFRRAVDSVSSQEK